MGTDGRTDRFADRRIYEGIKIINEIKNEERLYERTDGRIVGRLTG